jgi:hypothetical protein
MNAVPFDTLKMAQRLESAGFSGPQAAGAAEALAEALVGADLATKGDLNSLGTGLRGDMNSLGTGLRGEMGGLGTGLRGEMNSLGTGLRGEMGGVRGDMAALEARMLSAIELLRRDMTIKFGSMTIIAVGVLLAAIRYPPPHP